MAIQIRMGANPQYGARMGYADTYIQDPDQYANLQERKREYDEGAGRQSMLDQFKMNAFNKLSGATAGFGAVGGTPAPMPSINRNPLYSQGQIEQQTNQGVAANDARYQTLMKQLGSSAAGRGLGMSSPAIQSQLTQLGIANIGENARTEMQTPLQYVQANADQTFRTDQLAQNQWAQGEDVDIRRRQQQLQALSSLMSSLGGF